MYKTEMIRNFKVMNNGVTLDLIKQVSSQIRIKSNSNQMRSKFARLDHTFSHQLFPSLSK